MNFFTKKYSPVNTNVTNDVINDLYKEIQYLKKRIAILETPFKFSVGQKVKVDMCSLTIPTTSYVIVVERRRDISESIYAENYYVCYSDKLKMSFNVRECDIKAV